MDDALLEHHLARRDEHGCTILEGVVDLDLVDALDEDLRRLEHDLGAVPAGNSFEGSRTVRIDNLLVSSLSGGDRHEHCAGCVRQQENQQLGIPVDTVRRFPPRLRELVGYGVYHGLIGHIDKQRADDVLGLSSSPHRMVWDRA